MSNNTLNPETYFDLSLMKNRNYIAILMANSFNEINLSIIMSQIKNLNQSKNYIKPVDSIIKFEIDDACKIDVLNIDNGITPRFIDIRILYGNAVQMDIKVKYTTKIKYYFYLIIGTASNFIKYKNIDDIHYIRNHIIDNYTKALVKNTTIEGLEELRFVCDYINTNSDIVTKDFNTFEFKIEDVSYYVITENSTIKFQFVHENEDNYIYVPKDKIGVSMCSIIVEKAIKIKTK